MRNRRSTRNGAKMQGPATPVEQINPSSATFWQRVQAECMRDDLTYYKTMTTPALQCFQHVSPVGDLT